MYLGRLQMASGQDSLGIQSLRKAIELDTTQADAYGEIAKALYKEQKYVDAADNYKLYIAKSRKVTLNDYLQQGMSYYKAYTAQLTSTAKPKPVPDTNLLVKADTVFSYIQHKASAPVALVSLFQARAHDFQEPDRNTTKGLAKPYYEQYIAAVTAKGMKDSDKSFMVEAYDYLGTYYEFTEKDETKAAENFGKARDIDPTNKQALDYFKRKGGAGKSK
jgi:tetratricopeptide (TPR) repeat protein